MQRLEDILDKDLEYIFNIARDYVRETVVKVGAEEVTIMASLQSSEMEFSASERPINAYKLEFLCRTKDLPKSMTKKMSKDAIIYIDGTAYKIVDASDSRGVWGMSLERGSGRGVSMSGREL